MYTRVRGQFRSSSQTPLNLISRGLACTCRNFKGESHRPRRRRFARETRTCTSPPRVVSSSLCLLLFNPKQINLACAVHNKALSTTRHVGTQNRCLLHLYLIIKIIRIINFIILLILNFLSYHVSYFLLFFIFIFIFFYQFFRNGIFLHPE